MERTKSGIATSFFSGVVSKSGQSLEILLQCTQIDSNVLKKLEGNVFKCNVPRLKLRNFNLGSETLIYNRMVYLYGTKKTNIIRKCSSRDFQ
jgi:hypothetical protein